MRVRIIKSTRGFRQGDTVEVSRNVAFGLIDSGYATLTKDMTSNDYKTLDEEQANATTKVSKLRN